MNGDDKKMITEIFKPMDDSLSKLQRSFSGMETDVALIAKEQEHQGGYIEALQGDVRGIHDKVDRMPDTWRHDIKSAVSDHKKQDDEITSVTNVAKEQERAKRDRSASIIPSSTKNLFIKLLPYVIIGLGVLGAFFATKAGSPDAEDITKAVQAIERVEKKVDKMKTEKPE